MRPNWEKMRLPAALCALLLGLYQWYAYMPTTHFLELEVVRRPISAFETPWYYLCINAASIFFPFLLSFDGRVSYYKQWRPLFLAIALVGAFFILWDAFFTVGQVWGFNPKYLSGWEFLHLPLGEWLFFVTVPYSCLFIYACLQSYFPKLGTSPAAIRLYAPIILLLAIWAIAQWGRVYPSSTAWFAVAFLLYAIRATPTAALGRFLWAYLISWIPFILINGMLTGLFTQEPVVIYNPASFSNIRMLSIPLDDSIYSFLLLVMNVHFFERFKKGPI